MIVSPDTEHLVTASLEFVRNGTDFGPPSLLSQVGHKGSMCGDGLRSKVSRGKTRTSAATRCNSSIDAL